jgi:hypothetical protein
VCRGQHAVVGVVKVQLLVGGVGVLVGQADAHEEARNFEELDQGRRRFPDWLSWRSWSDSIGLPTACATRWTRSLLIGSEVRADRDSCQMIFELRDVFGYRPKPEEARGERVPRG